MGFANRARRSSTLLFERPYYRKNVPDALKQFENKANMEYAADAANIRDMRFRKSNEYNVDSALKNRREDMISQAYANADVDPDQAVGIHGRLGLTLSRTGGALSRFGVPKVTHRAPPPRRVAGAGAGAGAGGGAGAAGPVGPRPAPSSSSSPSAVTSMIRNWENTPSARKDRLLATRRAREREGSMVHGSPATSGAGAGAGAGKSKEHSRERNSLGITDMLLPGDGGGVSMGTRDRLREQSPTAPTGADVFVRSPGGMSLFGRGRGSPGVRGRGGRTTVRGRIFGSPKDK
jgi:hypothetical protein